MIRTTVRSVAVTFLLFGLTNAHNTAGAAPSPSNSCCNLVEQALKDFSAIRVGSKRADVERSFTESGGMSFGNQTVYVYKKCHYIKASITFTYAKTGAHSPVDVVNAVSELLIDYEAKD